MSEFRFCLRCGAGLETRPVFGHDRLVCGGCGFVLYRNPIVGVAVVLLDGEGVLLGRRARGRYRGVWTFPSGHVEWGEDIRVAARRECLEETGLEVEIGPVYAANSNFHDVDSLTVGVWFKGAVTGGVLRPGDELDPVGYYPLDALPGPVTFPTDLLVLGQLRGELPIRGLPG